MSGSQFLKMLEKHLYPILRAEGFIGKGQTLRRQRSQVIHIVNVEGSKRGGECYLNLGAHLAFLPPEGGLPVSIDTLDIGDCVFRDRIEPPAGAAFGWSYGDSIEEAEETVAFIVSEWPRIGHPFFNRYASYPASFERLVVESDPEKLHPRTTLHFARIAANLGQRERAREFIDSGFARTTERATNLKAAFEKLRDAIES
ncbi:TPA: DUF4304 domain-containing protein [Pseudomonas aeruginosa]